MGGADPAEIKKLKLEVNRLNKIISDTNRQAKVTENKITREKTMVQRQTAKAETDAENMRKRYENTKEKLNKKEEECKVTLIPVLFLL